MVLERLEAELLGDDDGDRATVEIPPPSTSNVPIPDASTLPLASQPSSLCGGRGGRVVVGVGRGSRPLPPTQDEETPTPGAHRSREKNLHVSHGKRKY